MKNVYYLLLIILSMLQLGCTPKVQENKITVVEKKVLIAASAKPEQYSGPISLSHRKLEVKEISKHLEMDEENTKLHLKDSNIHGYYSLLGQNYPPGSEFVLYQVDLARRVNPIKTYYVNTNGHLVSELDDLFIDLHNNYLFFSNYLPGEPVDFVLGSKDSLYFASTRIIPNPIEAKDALGHRISVELDHPDKRHYQVRCSGLEPLKTYMLVTVFENEKFVHAVESNENGELVKAAGPTVPWATGGDGSVELKGEGISPPLTVPFKWGA